MIYPVFDLHCDTALAMLGDNFFAEGTLRSNQFHIDLDRAGELETYCQCFACFTTPMFELPGRMTVEDMFERELSVLLREINGNADIISQAYTVQDILDNRKKGKSSAILTIEGPAGFGFDPELLENLYEIGFRITSLGWNEKNMLTGSHITGGGLTDRGRAYVKEAQRLGMLIDVSHISDEALWNIMDITNAPVIATHSNSRAVCDVSRNLTDEMFSAICRTGGVTGINLCPDFLGENSDLNTVCDHIIHFLELDPSGKHIALGGDLDGISDLPNGYLGIQSYNDLAQKMLERGIDHNTVMNIFWNNAFGVMQDALRNHKK